MKLRVMVLVLALGLHSCGDGGKGGATNTGNTFTPGLIEVKIAATAMVSSGFSATFCVSKFAYKEDGVDKTKAVNEVVNLSANGEVQIGDFPKEGKVITNICAQLQPACDDSLPSFPYSAAVTNQQGFFSLEGFAEVCTDQKIGEDESKLTLNGTAGIKSMDQAQSNVDLRQALQVIN